MYKDHWGLTDKPFQNVPDTRFIFYSESHEEALVRLLYCVTESKGLMLLLGRWGVGKTFICRTFQEKVRERGYDVALLHPPPLTVEDLHRQISDALLPGSPVNGRFETFKRIEEAALERAQVGREPVLVLDEAQFIRNPEVFEEIRFLLDMTRAGRFLINVILVGTQDLWKNLLSVEGLRQRIGLSFRIDPLTRTETEEYIMRRLKVAGLNHNIFEAGAVDLIHGATLGIPGRVNSLCDLSMLISSSEAADDIGQEIVQRAVDEISGSRIDEEEEGSD